MEAWSSAILDSHCHFWELGRFDYPWPTRDLVAIYRDHRPADLWDAMESLTPNDVVFVQCLNDCPDEAKWVMDLAKQHPRIKAIVAGLDPSHPQFEKRLMSLKEEVPLMVGLRHILDLEPRTNYLELPEVAAGLRVLGKHDMTFDLLLRPPLIEGAVVLAGRVPETRLVVDHLAKPYIKAGQLDPWRQHMTALARHPNVFCKLSSMVTEADLDKWKPDDLQPYVEHMLAVFGPDRLMFGSDWPVCHLAKADYSCVFNTLKGLLSHLPDHHLANIYGGNAKRFYKVK